MWTRSTRSAGWSTATGTAATARAAAQSMTARLVSPSLLYAIPAALGGLPDQHCCIAEQHIHVVNGCRCGCPAMLAHDTCREVCDGVAEQGDAVQASAATSAVRRSCAVRRAASAASSAIPTSPALVGPHLTSTGCLEHNPEHYLKQASGLRVSDTIRSVDSACSADY